MGTVTVIDPITRIEGHMKVEITVDTVNGVQQVVDAKSVGTMFRGFENILNGRHPLDAQHITERICGVCPVAHGMAAVIGLEAAFGVTPPPNALLLRNLVHGANYLDSHILHFYLLALLDFVNAPAMAPWQPTWETDQRFDPARAATLFAHYAQAIALRRKAHEMGAIFGGKLPHPPAYVPGGITAVPKADQIAKFKSYLAELTAFISNTYIPDVELLASVYDDYFSVGRGYGNLLAFGVFDLDPAGQTKLLRRGRVMGGNGAILPVDLPSIAESVTGSWYAESTNNLAPLAGVTTPQYPKTNAYSWLKSPRYGGEPYECGALARMWVNGDYSRGVSVMDRHRARAQEALKVAQAMATWIDGVQVGQPIFTTYTIPATAQGIGLTEAPRGALGHWIHIAGGKLSGYQIITPTCWNASPRDTAGKVGPLEKALIGTPVRNLDQPIEALRIVHSFDPCLDCAVHAIRPKSGARVIAFGGVGKRTAVSRAGAQSRERVSGKMNACSEKPVLVMGLGNVLLRDDGVGVHVARRLLTDPPCGAVVAEVGTFTLGALDLIEAADRILLVDAVWSGNPPGTIYIFPVGSAEESVHGGSLHELNIVGALRLLGRAHDPRILMLGIEPGMMDYGMEVSPEVREALPAAEAAARRIVMEWGEADWPPLQPIAENQPPVCAEAV